MPPSTRLPHGKHAIHFNSICESTASKSPGFSVKKPKLEPLELDEKSCQNFDEVLGSEGEEKRKFSQLSRSRHTEEQEIEGRLDFLSPCSRVRSMQTCAIPHPCPAPTKDVCRQFWKAGDYEGNSVGQLRSLGGMGHLRVHPKFLHSNATSHKWALGALAELFDNAVDEVVNGAMLINVDMIRNPQDGNPMLLIEDDGGGMSPDRLRQCMSLGYSVKSKSANTIGQYGNGFKTSTMRLGADVIVFSRAVPRVGCSPTESIGILSYTFLRGTGQEDIVVPMIDYEVRPFGLQKLVRSKEADWDQNMEIIKQWSPYRTETDLLNNFRAMKNQGTRIIIYNLWEDDQGDFELDFDADPCDIQVRGTNRDEKKISMASRYPNSRHYLTYRYSLRSYASILYLRLPKGFKMILRGKEIEQHSLVKDLMITQKVTYRPQGGPEQGQKEDTKMMALVTIGFVKDAKEHIDIQGFNVYHKNRLIKPFWRIWNSSSCQGRGVIGVLEANFVEPAHDKQGFERTTVLARLEARLQKMQKAYWFRHCHKVGYYNYSMKKKGKPVSEEDSFSSDDWPPQEGYRALPRRRTKQEALPFPFSLTFTRCLRSKRRRVPARAYMTAKATTERACVKSERDAVVISTNRPCMDRLGLCLIDGVNKQLEAVGNAQKFENYVGPKDEVENLLPYKAKVKVEPESLSVEVERSRQLKILFVHVKQKEQAIQNSIEKVTKERDSLREQLEEEQRDGEAEEEELRKKLKETLLRVRELEAENRRLRLSQN